MNQEKLDELWRMLSSATNIDKLAYGEAVTIGYVFGEMKKTIVLQRHEIERLKKQNQ